MNAAAALDRIAELEDLLGLKLPPTPARQIALQRIEEKICNMLVRHSLVHPEFFMRALYGGLPDVDQPNGFNVLAVHISKIRAKLKPHGITIKNRPGDGYYLPAPDRAKLKYLLQDRI